jgi:hypothetical protein
MDKGENKSTGSINYFATTSCSWFLDDLRLNRLKFLNDMCLFSVKLIIAWAKVCYFCSFFDAIVTCAKWSSILLNLLCLFVTLTSVLHEQQYLISTNKISNLKILLAMQCSFSNSETKRIHKAKRESYHIALIASLINFH